MASTAQNHMEPLKPLDAKAKDEDYEEERECGGLPGGGQGAAGAGARAAMGLIRGRGELRLPALARPWPAKAR